MKKPLVIAYSYSGHTHRIAQALCALTGGDLCEIYPWQPYPMAFPDLLQQVQNEIHNAYRPRLLPGAVSAREYSVIFAGSPNWCGHIAPPLASWLTKNDLSGKLVLPFYSHCGGVNCDFSREIAGLCQKTEVRASLGVLEDAGEVLPQILLDWMKKNGISIQPAAYVG